MSKFLLVYHGGDRGEVSQDQQAANMEAWMKWMGGLGPAIVDGGSPTSRAWTVSKDGTTEDAGANPATGYTIIEAESMQRALEMCAGCPHLEAGGTIELCETLNMGQAT
jgi:hypothetical protein